MLTSLLRNFTPEGLMNLLITLPVVLFSLSIHEMSHAWTAYKLGDSTARNFGRITLNPLKHIDPIGFLCMMIFRFGWAKPVPVNARNFRDARKGMALTAAAGPLSNLALAFISVILLVLSYRFLWFYFGSGSYAMVIRLVMMFFFISLWLNTALAIFNLMPFPPFDGSRLFYFFLPTKFYFGVMKYERYIMIAMMLLLVLGPLGNFIGFITQIIIKGFLFVTGVNFYDLYFTIYPY